MRKIDILHVEGCRCQLDGSVIYVVGPCAVVGYRVTKKRLGQLVHSLRRAKRSSMMEREQQKLLCAKGTTTEVRAFRDLDGDLVVVWWEFEDGEWHSDNGPKVPRDGVSGLAEFLLTEWKL